MLKWYDLLGVKTTLRESLNITSDAQERYVLEPTADIRKMLRALEQYAIAIGCRACEHFRNAGTLDQLIERAQALHERTVDGKTHQILQELQFVADYLVVSNLFHAGHDGDWRRTLAAFIQLAPLLFETERPNKSEEILSHLYRLARCSDREFFLITRRCLYQRYRGGEKVTDFKPAYNKYGDSESEERFVFNDENGEDLIGKLKVSGAHTQAMIVRQSKIHNYLQQRTTRWYRKRHKSTARTFADDPLHISCVSNMLARIRETPAAHRLQAATCKYSLAINTLGLALRRRLICRKHVMQHKHARDVVINYRQMVANMQWLEAQPAREGSWADWVSKGMPRNGLTYRARDGTSKPVKWHLKFASMVGGFLGMCALNCGSGPSSDVNNFGKANVAVRAYLRELRAKYLTISVAERNAMITPEFLEKTPLGTEKRRGAGIVVSEYPLIERNYIAAAFQ